VALFVVTTLVILCLGYAYYIHEIERVRQEKYEDIAAIAKLKVGSIQEWRKGLLDDVRALSFGPLWNRAVNEWLREPGNDTLQKDLRDRLIVGKRQGGYVDGLLLDLDGNVIVSVSGNPESVNAIEKKAIGESIASGSPVLSDMYRTPQGTISIDAVAPILDPKGRPIALGMYRTNSESVLFPLIQTWPTPSQTAETLLVRKDGDDVLFLNDLRHRQNTALSLREPLKSHDLPAGRAVSGKKGLFQGKDYRGVEVLADLRPIPDSPWFMVAKVDTSEILAEARYRGAVVIIFSGLFILLTAGFAAYGYRHRQARLYQDLYKSERELREAEELFRTTLYSIGDAVITTDTRGLAQRMNPVAERLTGWQEAEAAGKSLDEVFHIVEEESRKPVQNPVRRVLSEGVVVGLANHTVLISRDGSEWPIADSGAPIRSEDGSILGVVLVFRDQTEEKVAEELLKQSEARYRSLFENIGSAVAVYKAEQDGADFILVDFNAAAEKIDRIDRSDVIGHSVLKVFPGIKEFGLFEVFQRVWRTGEPERHPVTLYKDDRTQGWRDNYVYKLSSGEIVTVYSDETRRIRAEETATLSQERLELVLKGANLGLWDIDMPKGQAVINERAANIAGYQLDEITPTLDFWQSILHPDDEARALKAFGDHLAGHTDSYESEYRVKTKSGEYRWVLAMGKVMERGADGIALRVTGAFQDITDRKKVEEALRESEERYRIVAQFTYDWEYWVDSEGNFLYVAPSCERITGYSAEEFIADPDLMNRIIHPDDRPEMLDHYHNVRKVTPDAVDAEDFRIVRRDGEIRWIGHVCQPVYDQDGQPLGRRSSNRDITSRKTLEAQLLQAQKMEAIGNLAGGIAHDFNNLLQAVMGYSELLLAGKKQGDPELDDLQRIYDSGKRGADLVNSLLMFSRKVQPAFRPVDLNNEIVQVQKLLSHSIPKTIKIDLRLSGALETVLADPSQVGQVIMNLGVNARDSMPDGGTLTIETANVELDKDYCAVHLEVKPGPYVLLTVSDSGHGMDKQTLTHIFEPFFTTKEVGKGTGLGLATVYGIVKQHGGHITIYSEPGLGTTFKIYLPAIQTDRKSETQTQEIIIPGGTETILLVDDEESLRELGSRILSEYGYRVMTASNGKEALELYQREDAGISLIILDLIMPEMDGRKCLEEVLRVNPKARVVLASGYSESGPGSGAMTGGAKGFVHKPYNMRQLLTTIREILDKN
jgi:PAS domain S-box-containing protein